MRSLLLVLADRVRAELAGFSAAVERDDLDAAASKLDAIGALLNEAVKELRA